MMLVRERMNPRVVMEGVGWDDYQSLEPYLSKPDEGTIIDEFSRAGRDSLAVKGSEYLLEH